MKQKEGSFFDKLRPVKKIRSEDVQCIYGPPWMLNGTPPPPPGGMIGASSEKMPRAEQPVMMEDGKWQCTCGMVSSGKFCPECGTPAPDDL